MRPAPDSAARRPCGRHFLLVIVEAAVAGAFRKARRDQRARQVARLRPADGEGAAEPVLLPRGAGQTGLSDQLLEQLARRSATRPFRAGRVAARLAIFRRVDAAQPYFLSADPQAVAVDDADLASVGGVDRAGGAALQPDRQRQRRRQDQQSEPSPSRPGGTQRRGASRRRPGPNAMLSCRPFGRVRPGPPMISADSAVPRSKPWRWRAGRLCCLFPSSPSLQLSLPMGAPTRNGLGGCGVGLRRRLTPARSRRYARRFPEQEPKT
jgi:hypothetical protein